MVFAPTDDLHEPFRRRLGTRKGPWRRDRDWFETGAFHDTAMKETARAPCRKQRDRSRSR